MLSSTYRELAEHRSLVKDAALSQDLFPVAMENDAALPDLDLISASLKKVDEADGYVGLISYRYGQTPVDAERNPEGLSLTELEFRRAVARKIPICMFIMNGDHPVPRSAVDEETDAQKEKLKAFMELARKDRIYAEFKSEADLRAKAVQSLIKLRDAIDARGTPFAPPADEARAAASSTVSIPAGWSVVDREQLQSIRANPPALSAMVQFFDGILPTWQLVTARGVESRAVVERLAGRLRAVLPGATKPQILLLAGAGGEGKSTAILQAAAALVEDPNQSWTCLHRQAANTAMPEDLLETLPLKPNHAWVVVIDDADNIAASILAAVKKVAARTDVHLILAARDAEWQSKKLVPAMWQPFAEFRLEPLVGLDQEDARRVVAGWVAWGDDAMGRLKGLDERSATTTLLGHARDLAARREAGELLGALLITRHGQDMRAHVRTLIIGLSKDPVINGYSLHDIYAMVAAMHAENQLYLSRSVLAFAVRCTPDALDANALTPLRREALLDEGDLYVLTRHRRIAEAACDVLREDGYDVDRWYAHLARAALRDFKVNYTRDPRIQDWNTALAAHFVDKGDRWWAVARAVAKATFEAEPGKAEGLTNYSSVLRDTRAVAEAVTLLRAEGGKFPDNRSVLYEWGTVAALSDNNDLGVWLQARSVSDSGTPFTPKTCKISLAGLGQTFKRLFAETGAEAFASAHGACGQLGLRLAELDPKARSYFELHKGEGERNGVAEFTPEQGIDVFRKAVVLAVNDIEPDKDPAFFEQLLGEPESYRYTNLLHLVGGRGGEGQRARAATSPGAGSGSGEPTRERWRTRR